MFSLDYQKLMAKRIRELRLERGYTQREIAKRAGLKIATYKVFEQTGKISLQRLYQVATVVHRQHEMEGIFKALPIQSLSQLVPAKKRQRGKKASP